MIFLLLVRILCNNIVFVGFQNETLFIDPLKLEIDNANIQNFQDYEYIAMNYPQKGIHNNKEREQIVSHAVREINDNQFQFYDIWSLHKKKDYYKIMKITPYLDYKEEQIYEFTQKGLICQNLHVLEEKLIIDCSNYLDQSINLIEFNFINNKSNSLNITSDYDNLRLSRKIYYSSDYLIILYKEIDNNIISIYDIKLKYETLKCYKSNFDLPKLNIKKIIIQKQFAYILTQCEKLYKIYLQYSCQGYQICKKLQFYDIQEKIGVDLLMFTKYHRHKLIECENCIDMQYTLNQPQMFQIFKDGDDGLAYKFNFLNQLPEQLQNCKPFNSQNFYYNQQMLLCQTNYNLYQVVLPIARFQQITISNNFYNNDKHSIIIRALEPSEIIFIQSGEKFFPFIIYIQSDTIEVQHSKLFHGPNISQTLKAEYVQASFHNYQLVNFYENEGCVYMDLVQFRLLQNFISLICQFSNKTIIVRQNHSKYYFPYSIQFIYNIDFNLNSSYYIAFADSQNICIINADTRQIRSFNSLNGNPTQVSTIYEHPEYFACQLLIDSINCKKLPKLDKNFTFNLSYIKRLNLNQEVRFAYMPQQTFNLFLVTQNYVIVIHIDMIEDIIEQFQLVQLFKVNYEIKQLYYSRKIVYVLCSDEGYLRILKYFEISPYYFKKLGQIDCLGYQINNQLYQDNNGGDDHYFVNSLNDVIVFQLSRSLQDSLLFVIPNATFLKSYHYQFCLEQDYQIMCYNFAYNFSQLKIDLDKLKFSQIVPFEVCAQNSKTKKCIRQNLKLLIRQQKLIINGYQLTQINSYEYQIDFNIKQGYISDLSILDGNAMIIQNSHFILKFNQTLIQLYELQDSILLSCSGQLLKYDKRQQIVEKIQNISCLKAFLISSHLLCFKQGTLLSIYFCNQQWDCNHKNEILFKELTDVQVSGGFILLKLQAQVKILQYRPKTYDFRNIFADERGSKFDFIQFINDYDFWFIRIKDDYLLLYRFANLQLQTLTKFNYLERFNLDNQFTDKNDEIVSVLSLRNDLHSITLMFLMKLSSDKAYQISITNDQMDIQCIFILFGDKPDIYDKAILFSLNQELLLIITNKNKVGVYNVSTNLDFHRNMIFNIHINISNLTTAEQYIKRMYHFIYNDRLYLFVQTIKQCFLYQVDLNYKIKMIGNHSHISVNINRMNENILLRIEIPNLNETNNNPYYLILIILLVIVYIFRRYRIAK